LEGVHLLLGIARENIELLNRFLSPSVSESTLQNEITNGVSTSGADLLADIPFSSECKRVLSFADEEATMLRSELMAPENLLLGMLREKNSYAAVLLREYGAELERIRKGLP
jgi:ATP-dependent Clp protease ATP-binding subunit ClpC